MGNIAELLLAEGVLADTTLATSVEATERLGTHFKAARFDLVTEETVTAVDGTFVEQLKKAQNPRPTDVAIIQAIMYILGHQQRDVSEWPKCRKLLTHHLFKEMRMIDPRSPLKVHKLKLAQECIQGLGIAEARATGPSSFALWKWVQMILEVQELE